MANPAALWRWLRQWRRTHLNVPRAEVLHHIDDGGALGARFVFMTVMSCGIAMLGLLQNSVAVIIGAMLISPLMGPIVEMGMSLATFDFRTLRSALATLAVGVATALLISVLIVTVSPLREATPEILARTQPTLFDLLVAVFSGLAGAYATITRKGETIVGVAIATALMPPLAVVGFGIATGNGGIAGGAGFLFMTNLLAIALSVTIMGRWYGFGGHDTPKQTAWQATLIVGSFVLLSVPLGLALRDIAARGVAEATVRNTLDDDARRNGGRIATLRVDSSGATLNVDATLLTPQHRPQLASALERKLETALGRPVVIDLQEVLTADDASLAREQNTLAQLRESVLNLQGAAQRDAAKRDAGEQALRQLRASAIAHFGEFELVQGGNQARWRLRARAGLDLSASRRLESALLAQPEGPRVQVVPALQALPTIGFAAGSAELDTTALNALQDTAWALARWQNDAVRVQACAGGDTKLAQARADAVAGWLREQGIAVEAARAASVAETRALAARDGAAAAQRARIEPVLH